MTVVIRGAGMNGMSRVASLFMTLAFLILLWFWIGAGGTGWLERIRSPGSTAALIRRSRS